MTDEELKAFEDGRDFHADLLQSIHEMKAGHGTGVHSQAIAARYSLRIVSDITKIESG